MENTASNFFSDAFKLAASTALRLVDLSAKEENKLDKNALSLAISILTLDALPEITLDQVSWHDHLDDCWIVLYDRVYDITEFLEQHPGGADVLLEYAGRDATLAYRGFGHSAQAWQILQKYLIGVLPEKERAEIFRDDENLFGMSYQLKAASS